MRYKCFKMVEEGGKDYGDIFKKESDPRQLISNWRASREYQEYQARFFEGKRLVEGVTEEEKREAFEEDRKAKDSLLFFVKDQKIDFVYDPKYYSQKSQGAMKLYIKAVRDMFRTERGGGGEEVVACDRLRAMRHDEVAQDLVEEGIVLSTKIGRTLARLVLISEGLDTFKSAQRSDIDRVRVLAAE